MIRPEQPDLFKRHRMLDLGRRLLSLPRIGRDVFTRPVWGTPPRVRYQVSLDDLVAAYARVQARIPWEALRDPLDRPAPF